MEVREGSADNYVGFYELYHLISKRPLCGGEIFENYDSHNLNWDLIPRWCWILCSFHSGQNGRRWLLYWCESWQVREYQSHMFWGGGLSRLHLQSSPNQKNKSGGPRNGNMYKLFSKDFHTSKWKSENVIKIVSSALIV